MEPTAKLLGMEISLLERYAAQMTMLQIQYRMVRDIIQYREGRGGRKRSIMVPPRVITRCKTGGAGWGVQPSDLHLTMVLPKEAQRNGNKKII